MIGPILAANRLFALLASPLLRALVEKECEMRDYL